MKTPAQMLIERAFLDLCRELNVEPHPKAFEFKDNLAERMLRDVATGNFYLSTRPDGESNSYFLCLKIKESEASVDKSEYQVVPSHDGSPVEGCFFKGTFDECKSYIQSILKAKCNRGYDLDILSSATGRLVSYVL